jgi:hypothetical protein
MSISGSAFRVHVRPLVNTGDWRVCDLQLTTDDLGQHEIAEIRNMIMKAHKRAANHVKAGNKAGSQSQERAILKILDDAAKTAKWNKKCLEQLNILDPKVWTHVAALTQSVLRSNWNSMVLLSGTKRPSTVFAVLGKQHHQGHAWSQAFLNSGLNDRKRMVRAAKAADACNINVQQSAESYMSDKHDANGVLVPKDSHEHFELTSGMLNLAPATCWHEMHTLARRAWLSSAKDVTARRPLSMQPAFADGLWSNVCIATQMERPDRLAFTFWRSATDVVTLQHTLWNVVMCRYYRHGNDEQTYVSERIHSLIW